MKMAFADKYFVFSIRKLMLQNLHVLSICLFLFQTLQDSPEKDLLSDAVRYIFMMPTFMIRNSTPISMNDKILYIGEANIWLIYFPKVPQSLFTAKSLESCN